MLILRQRPFLFGETGWDNATMNHVGNDTRLRRRDFVVAILGVEATDFPYDFVSANGAGIHVASFSCLKAGTFNCFSTVEGIWFQSLM